VFLDSLADKGRVRLMTYKGLLALLAKKDVRDKHFVLLISDKEKSVYTIDIYGVYNKHMTIVIDGRK
jgi:hypothetical protein